jgi:hypothetical protein
MSYRLKGPKVILEGDINKIVAQTLPVTPEDGQFVIDSADKKLKVWNATANRWIILGDAVNQVFDNSSNGFTATNTQAAIEESKASAPGKARASIVCTFNGTIGNNNWLGYSELIPGDQVPILIPWNCILKELTVVYQNAFLGSPSIDGRLDLYKNGTAGGNIVHQITFTNDNDGGIFTPDISFNAGDQLRGRWVDQGDNPADMVICYFFLLL